MGNLFGSAKKESTDQTQNTTQTQNTSGTYSSTPTFTNDATGVIKSLSGNFGNIGTDAGNASTFLTSLVNGGGMNPYAQQVVEGQNRLANADFAKRLAGVRSSGYGGGIGRDLIDQGMFTSDYTNRQYDANARTLLDAWNTDRTNRLSAASQLGGLDATRLQSAISFINSLRGETGTQQQTGTGTSNTASKGTTKQTAGGFNLAFGK